MPCNISVLIVDDDFGFRHALADALGEWGWEVRGAANGVEALGIIRGWRPSVVVLDLALPVMDARAFRLEADRQHAFEGIPVVLISGAAEAHSEAERLGAVAALQKPFDLDDLVQIIRAALGPRYECQNSVQCQIESDTVS